MLIMIRSDGNHKICNASYFCEKGQTNNHQNHDSRFRIKFVKNEKEVSFRSEVDDFCWIMYCIYFLFMTQHG